VPKWYAGFTGSFDVSLGMGFLNLDHLNRVFNLKVRKMEKKVEFFSESSVWEMGTRENYMQVFGNLRTKSNDIFEGWITDKVRTEIMGGLK
jgi:xylose isomerase